MVTKKEIYELKENLVKFYSETRSEQQIDQEYYDDVFRVPQIKEPAKLSRTGVAARIVDAPAEHIITSNPQVDRPSKKKDDKDANERILKMINQDWMPFLRSLNPNPFKENVKNCLLRGESWIQVTHNEDYGNGWPPVFTVIPDPMIVYADLDSIGNPIPKRVIVKYDRVPWSVSRKYPDLEIKQGDSVEWLEYWDKDYRYFEAGGIPVLKGGIQKNIY